MGPLLYPLNPLPNVEAVTDSEHENTLRTKVMACLVLPLVWRAESGPPPSKDKEMNKAGRPFPAVPFSLVGYNTIDRKENC